MSPYEEGRADRDYWSAIGDRANECAECGKDLTDDDDESACGWCETYDGDDDV